MTGKNVVNVGGRNVKKILSDTYLSTKVKTLTLILLSVILQGCEVDEWEESKSKLLCEKHGGLTSVDKGITGVFRLYCRDGTYLKLSTGNFRAADTTKTYKEANKGGTH